VVKRGGAQQFFDSKVDMKIYSKTTLAILMVTASVSLAATPALAHSFNVALVLPGQPATSEQARQLRQGFMLATTERDAHPDQESDGHLGGLDVYVKQADTPTGLDADIVVLLGSKETIGQFTSQIDQNQVTILVPGNTPFSNTDNPGVTNFITTYTSAYGSAPTAQAAQGYNAARRIAAAIRAQGSADDKSLLSTNFKQTADSFTW